MDKKIERLKADNYTDNDTAVALMEDKINEIVDAINKMWLPKQKEGLSCQD